MSFIRKMLSEYEAGIAEFTNTEERLRIGLTRSSNLGNHGMSATADRGTGGANYFFTRVSKPGMSTRGEFHFDIRLIGDVDAIPYRSDMYGKVTGSHIADNMVVLKPGGVQESLTELAQYVSNETILKGRIPLDALVRVNVPDKAARKEAIKLFKDKGIHRLGGKGKKGIRIEDVIKVIGD